MTMNNNTKRVLGRILAVEETMEVSGAKQTTPCRDMITSLKPPSLDTAVCEVNGGDSLQNDTMAKHASNIF